MMRELFFGITIFAVMCEFIAYSKGETWAVINIGLIALTNLFLWLNEYIKQWERE